LEFDRKKALEARGGYIVSSSGALFTLIIGLAVVVAGSGFTIHHPAAVGFAIASTVTFVGAAIVGLAVQGMNSKYDLTSDETLTSMVTERWGESAEAALFVTARRNVETIGSLRKSNDSKAIIARWGLGLQIAAIALLGMSFVAELVSYR